MGPIDLRWWRRVPNQHFTSVWSRQINSAHEIHLHARTFAVHLWMLKRSTQESCALNGSSQRSPSATAGCPSSLSLVPVTKYGSAESFVQLNLVRTPLLQAR